MSAIEYYLILFKKYDISAIYHLFVLNCSYSIELLIIKETLFLTNHPSTLWMIIPFLRITQEIPNTTIVTAEIWKLFAWAISVIPVDISLSKYHDDPRLFPAVENAVLRNLGKIISLPESSRNPVDAMVQELQKGRNVLIAPAGRPAKNHQEHPWRNGPSSVLHQIPNANVAFIEIIGPFNYRISEHYPAINFIDKTPKDTTQNLRLQFEQIFFQANRNTHRLQPVKSM